MATNFREITVPPVKTGNREIDVAWQRLIEALKEIYKELKRLEADKQDA